jgi:hypothetical protein
VIDHGAGQSHLSVFTYNRFGELAAWRFSRRVTLTGTED